MFNTAISISSVSNSTRPVKKGSLADHVKLYSKEIEKIIAKNRIEEFAGLGYGWDGYDGESVSGATLELSKTIAEIMVDCSIHIDFIVPLRNGGVQFEFQLLNNECEIEVHPNVLIYFLWYDSLGNLLGKEQITITQLKKFAS
ncbi:MAG: hypothetical protein IT258_10870 [Saprospiraceae bacterium]|nr:hypothetical protein [Saprospiraceae bacterium]